MKIKKIISLVLLFFVINAALSFQYENASAAENNSNSYMHRDESLSGLINSYANKNFLKPTSILNYKVFSDWRKITTSYRTKIGIALNNKIISKSTYFKPKDSVTRIEFARWAVSVLKKAKYALPLTRTSKVNPFKDLSVSQKNDALYLFNRGLMVGRNASYFAPNFFLKRYEYSDVKKRIAKAITVLLATPTPTPTPKPAPTPTPIVRNPGIFYRIYSTSSELDQLPSDEYDPNLVYLTDGTASAINLDIIPEEVTENFFVVFEGEIFINKEGDYNFSLSSDDGSALYIDDNIVVDNDGIHGVNESTETVSLTPGYHKFLIEMFQSQGDMYLSADYSGPGFDYQLIDDSVLTYSGINSPIGRITDFEFLKSQNPNLPWDLHCDIDSSENKITGFLPAGIDLKTLKPKFEVSVGDLFFSGKLQISENTANNFSKAVIYKLNAGDFLKSLNYSVELSLLDSDVPSLMINTMDKASIDSKDVYVNGTVQVSGGTVPYAKDLIETAAKFKGRGNFTWTLDKKPYKIKFSEPTNLFDMGSEREWVMLANHADLSLMRNYLALETANYFEKTGYTPRMRFVDLFINGEYEGLYLVGDQIEVSKTRLNLNRAPTNDTGILLELDFRAPSEGTLGVDYFRTSGGMNFAYRSPENLNIGQKDFIRNYVQNVENAFNNNLNYESLIDLDSFADWFLIETFFKNYDSHYNTSCNFYRDFGGKLKMGPVWDFDLAIGNESFNTFCSVPTGWYPKGYGTWIDKLFSNVNFRNKLRERWNLLKTKAIDTLPALVDQTANSIRKSFELNFTRWPIMGIGIWPMPDDIIECYGLDAQVQYIKNWLDTRTKWIDSEIQKSKFG